ncbi:MAG: DUF4142 domain-containing protein [Flavitalea sp.]
MKKLSFITMLFLAGWTIQSCNDGNQDSIGRANESNETKMDSADSGAMAPASTVSEDDTRFSVNAASGGLMEVQAAELASQKALNPKVKEFAATLVKDHMQTNEELKALAVSKNITLPATPGEEHQKNLDKLAEKSGKEFDKEYIEHMVSDHKEDIDAFEKASNECKDPEIKAFAAKTLPVLRSHLQTAESISKSIK